MLAHDHLVQRMHWLSVCSKMIAASLQVQVLCKHKLDENRLISTTRFSMQHNGPRYFEVHQSHFDLYLSLASLADGKSLQLQALFPTVTFRNVSLQDGREIHSDRRCLTKQKPDLRDTWETNVKQQSLDRETGLPLVLESRKVHKQTGMDCLERCTLAPSR